MLVTSPYVEGFTWNPYVENPDPTLDLD